MAEEEEKINTDIDDWLNDLEDQDSGGEELDQADIDSLLGSDTETAAADDSDVENEELSGDLGQGDIDSLLGDGTEEESADTPEAPEEGTIDQEEMDKLFGSSADQDGVGEEVDFAEILGDQDDSPLSDFDNGNAFDAEAFSLEPEEDEDKTVMQPSHAASGGPFGSDVPPADAESEGDEVASAAMAAEAQTKPLSLSRVFQVLFGVLVVLLLGGGAYYFMMTGEEKGVVITESEKPVAPSPQKESPPMKPNHKPVALGSLYQMPKGGGEVAIQLRADDADGDPLTYELVDPPSHGRLSGKAPSLVYLPNADFSGTDNFSFRASDGKDFGEKTEMVIVGPNLAAGKRQKDAGEQVALQKKQPTKIMARDADLTTTSSESLVVDLLAIWDLAGNGSVDSSCGAEVKAGPLQGTLSQLDEWHYQYRPPKFFQGREIISYRFKRGKHYSVNRLLTLKISLGDNAPEIVLAPLDQEYLAGQPVTIDVRGSRDEQRDKLRFVWQQLAGVPVKLQAGNSEGSVVSFIMPAVFSTDTDSGVIVQVTAMDAGGKKSSRDILLHSLWRCQQALWTELAFD